MNEQARASVHLDGQQAQDQLKQLKAQATEMRKELEKMKLAKDPEYANKKREFSQLDAEIKKLNKGSFDLNATLKNLSGASYKDLTRAHQQLRSQLRHVNRDTAEGKKEFASKALALKNVRNEMEGLNKQMTNNTKVQQTNRGGIGQIRMAWVAAAGAIMGAYRSIQSFLSARDEQMRRSAELLYAMDGEEEATRRLIRVAGDLQRTRGVSDEEIKGQMAFLAIQGRTEKQIENTMKASLELSKVMGIGLAQAVQYLDGTFEGNIGRLGRLDARFKDLTKEQLANGAAVDLVNEKYQGLAETSFKEGLGPMRAYQLAWGDLQKTLGAFLIGGFNRFASAFADGLNKINRALEDTLKSGKEKFDEQLDSVVNLERDVRPLLDRYDELATKSNLSTSEQSELNEIIKVVSGSIPGAVTQFNAYGEAIAISTDRARDFVDTETDRLKVVNAKAISETEKNIKKREKLLEESQSRITEIEKNGYFEVAERERNSMYSTTIVRRQATQEEINDQIAKHQNLLSEVNGYQAELGRLNGDYLKTELERRQQKDELAAQSVAQQQEREKENAETVRNDAVSAYQQLTSEITRLETKYRDLAAVADAANALAIRAQIQSMEAQKIIMDNLIAAGGDPGQMIATLSDSTIAELDELSEHMAIFLEENQALSDEYREKRDKQREEDLQKDFAASDARLERKRWEEEQRDLKEKKDREEKEAVEEESSKLWLQLTQQTLASGFQIFSAFSNARSERQLRRLDTEMQQELSSETLTESQRTQIIEKYEKLQSEIKQKAFKKQRAADIIQSIINNALAISRAVAAPPGFPLNATSVALVSALGAIQTAAIAAQPVPQFKSGRYSVRGASDGRIYHPELAGTPITGIYNSPALIAEAGPELIVDAPTTKNIRLNYPHLLDAIMAVRVPQHASGRYPETTTYATGTGDIVSQLTQLQNETRAVNSRTAEALTRLEERLRFPIKAEVSILGNKGLEDKTKEYEQLKKNAYN